MATRSTIGVLHSDRSVSHVYCHSDGYPSWNGKRLQEHWASEKKAKALIKPGAMSVLGEIVGKKHDFSWREKLNDDPQFRDAAGLRDWDKISEAEVADPRSKYTRYYRRDRGDKENDLKLATASYWSDHMIEEYA